MHSVAIIILLLSLFYSLQAGDKLKKTKKEPVRTSKKQNWGGGMACVKRQKICYMVRENHCGQIPGVDVGTTWLFRIQVKETFRF